MSEEKEDWLVITTVLVKYSTRQEALVAAKEPGVEPAAICHVTAMRATDLGIERVKDILTTRFGAPRI